MDAERVRMAVPGLTERMAALGYSRYYVHELERFCRWLADEADGFETWAEAEKAVRARWTSDSAGKRMLRHLRRVACLVEHDGLPAPCAKRTVADTARTRIGEGFRTVLEAYENVERQIAERARGTLNNVTL